MNNAFVVAPLPSTSRRTTHRRWVCTATRPDAPTDAPAAAEPPAERVARALSADLPRLFVAGGDEGHYELYAKDVRFRDPVTSFKGVKRYQMNIQMLRDSIIFTDTKMDTYDVRVTSEAAVTTRWALSMSVRFLPWRPRLSFTGTSVYGLDTSSGYINSHIDAWDSLGEDANARTGAPEAVLDLVRQMGPEGTYRSAGPPYRLLRRAKTQQIELREYTTVVSVGGNVKAIRAAGGAVDWVVDGKIPPGKVAAIRLRSSDSAAQVARQVAEIVAGEGWAKPRGDTCIVEYGKQSVWEKVQLWEAPVRELWVAMEDVDVSVTAGGLPDGAK